MRLCAGWLKKVIRDVKSRTVSRTALINIVLANIRNSSSSIIPRRGFVVRLGASETGKTSSRPVVGAEQWSRSQHYVRKHSCKRHTRTRYDKNLSYCRVTARCVLPVVILPITTQQCTNYLYDKS